eukprot:gene8571-17681_t
MLVCGLTLSTFSMVTIFFFSRSIEYGGTTYFGLIALAIVGLGLALTCVIGMRGAHLVSLELLLIHFWAITVFIAPLVLGVVICFIFLFYMDTWVNHNWDSMSFDKFRSLFCDANTANTKCRIPIASLYNSTAYCLEAYNATDCSQIRTNAQQHFIRWGRGLTFTIAAIGLLNIVEIFGSMYLCYHILTVSVLSQSMNEFINYLLILPVSGCFGLGYYLWHLRQYPLPSVWLPFLFYSLGAVLSMLVPFGIIAGRMKSQVMLATYVVISALALMGLVVAATLSFVYSTILSTALILSRELLTRIACDASYSGCCCCESDSLPQDSRCPDWSSIEIIQVLINDMLLSGTTAVLSTVYVSGALFVAEVVRRNLKNYKCEYV